MYCSLVLFPFPRGVATFIPRSATLQLVSGSVISLSRIVWFRTCVFPSGLCVLLQLLADFDADDLFEDIGAGFLVFAGRLGFLGGGVL